MSATAKIISLDSRRRAPQITATNVIDLGWARRAGEREAAGDRYATMLAKDTSGWVRDNVFAEEMGLPLGQIRALMDAGWPHFRIGRTRMTKLDTALAWLAEFCPEHLPQRDRRATISPATREAVYRRDGYQCVRCHTGRDLSLDHIKPWSLGGSDEERNLQTLCRSCNSAKGDRT